MGCRNNLHKASFAWNVLALVPNSFYNHEHHSSHRSIQSSYKYNRISNDCCTIHSNIYNPDYVVVVDETLLSSQDVTHGLNPDGAIVINSEHKAEDLRPLLRGYKGKVFTINAREISEKYLGRYFPNTPMLAAIVQVSKVVEPERFIQDMEASFKHKFASKPQVVEGNMNCLREAMKEVR